MHPVGVGTWLPPEPGPDQRPPRKGTGNRMPSAGGPPMMQSCGTGPFPLRAARPPTPAGPVLEAQVESCGSLGGGAAVNLHQQRRQGALRRRKVLQAAAGRAREKQWGWCECDCWRGGVGWSRGGGGGGGGVVLRRRPCPRPAAPPGLFYAQRTGAAPTAAGACLVARPVEVHVRCEAALGLELHHRGLRQVAWVHLHDPSVCAHM